MSRAPGAKLIPETKPARWDERPMSRALRIGPARAMSRAPGARLIGTKLAHAMSHAPGARLIGVSRAPGAKLTAQASSLPLSCAFAIASGLKDSLCFDGLDDLHIRWEPVDLVDMIE